ncbi:MAG TPA: FAD:protein FMN transferase, partial [Acidimicrobiales bacterium]|nr:FAD:protein FMN transferase [Acidimicrobiales bacterium]
MACRADVVVVGGDHRLLGVAEARLRRLDRLWSRFRPGSDVTRLNLAAGAPVPVAPETLLLLERSVAAWRASGGAFDPTLLPALVAAGDVASRDDPAARTALPPDARWPGDPGGITTARDTGEARLPRGTALDPGGLGKGLAADLVVGELLAGGARGALVSVGGDLRVAGTAPRGAWSVAVEDPHDRARPRAVLALADGGVATSAPAARRWRHHGDDRHHLLSPTTGRPSTAPVASATVAAATAAEAEALAKVPYALGPVAAAVALDAAGVAAVVVGEDGSATATG